MNANIYELCKVCNFKCFLIQTSAHIYVCTFSWMNVQNVKILFRLYFCSVVVGASFVIPSKWTSHIEYTLSRFQWVSLFLGWLYWNRRHEHGVSSALSLTLAPVGKASERASERKRKRENWLRLFNCHTRWLKVTKIFKMTMKCVHLMREAFSRSQ